MSAAVENLIIAVCYLIVIILIAGTAVFFLLTRQAKVIKKKTVRADSVLPERKKYVKLIRIALISDMHIPMMPPSGEEIISAIKSGNPDYVVVAGDLCSNRKYRKEVSEFLSRLEDEVGTKIFVVLGNHDIGDVCGNNYINVKKYIETVENSGCNIKVLKDESYVTECHGTGRKILFGGFNDYRHSNADVSKSLCRKWKKEAEDCGADFVLIAHNPDSTEFIENGAEPAAALFGHTHGGQVWLPFNFEFRFLRSDKLPRRGYKYGLYLYENRFPIYITSGVGCTFLPIRFRTSAEIVFFDI